MSSPTNVKLQEELDRMRTIIGQYRQTEIETAADDLLLQNNTLVNTLHMRIEEMERENVLRSPLSTPNSPIPAHNLQPAMTSVAPMDGAIVQQIVDTSIASLETKISWHSIYNKEPCMAHSAVEGGQVRLIVRPERRGVYLFFI